MSVRNRNSNCVNAMWKSFIYYSSFSKYIICHSGYKSYEHRDMEKSNLFPRVITSYVVVLTVDLFNMIQVH